MRDDDDDDDNDDDDDDDDDDDILSDRIGCWPCNRNTLLDVCFMTA